MHLSTSSLYNMVQLCYSKIVPTTKQWINTIKHTFTLMQSATAEELYLSKLLLKYNTDIETRNQEK